MLDGMLGWFAPALKRVHCALVWLNESQTYGLKKTILKPS